MEYQEDITEHGEHLGRVYRHSPEWYALVGNTCPVCGETAAFKTSKMQALTGPPAKPKGPRVNLSSGENVNG